MINNFGKYVLILEDMRKTLNDISYPLMEDEDGGFDGDENCTGEEDCECDTCMDSGVASTDDDSDDTGEEKNSLRSKAAFTWLQNVYTPFKLDKKAKEKSEKKGARKDK